MRQTTKRAGFAVLAFMLAAALWGQNAADYRKAAEAGDADAQNNLGLCYYNGTGVAQDYAQAVQWYTKAADQGYAKAQFNLALCYYNGAGLRTSGAVVHKSCRPGLRQGTV